MSLKTGATHYDEGGRMNFCSYPRSGSHWILETLSKCTNGIFPRKSGGWRALINKSHSLHIFRNPVVYLCRHGKDSILSYAKFMHHRFASNVRDFNSKYLREMIIENQLPLQWRIHMDHYFSQNNTKICYIRYEDMLRMPINTLKIIMRFYGMDILHLDEQAVWDSCGLLPALSHVYPSGKRGYLPQLKYVKTGRASPDHRMAAFTERWKGSEEWTEEVEMIVNDYIGETLLKYGYLP